MSDHTTRRNVIAGTAAVSLLPVASYADIAVELGQIEVRVQILIQGVADEILIERNGIVSSEDRG